MNEIQKVLLYMLKDLDSICKKNDLMYVLIGGSMLGARRHKGFIPWDDDIDVGMPRSDFNTLLFHADILSTDRYQFQSVLNMKGYKHLHIKMVNRGTTLIEVDKDGNAEKTGINIDIFPIDLIGNNQTQAVKFLRYNYKLQSVFYSSFANGASTSRQSIKSVISKLIGARLIYRLITWILTQNSKKKMNVCANVFGAWGYREINQYSSVFPPNECRFEDEDFNGVSNPDLYLTSLYKDFLSLPPIEKQVSHHKYISVLTNTPYESEENNNG